MVGILHSGFPDSVFLLPGGKGVSSLLFRPPPTTVKGPDPVLHEHPESPSTEMALSPADTKQPLPNSTSILINPDRPSSWDAWRTSLKEVKVLFLKRQYKECRLRCDWLLEDSDNLVSFSIARLPSLTYRGIQPSPIQRVCVMYSSSLPCRMSSPL